MHEEVDPQVVVDEPRPEPSPGRIAALLNSTSLLSTTALMAAVEPRKPQPIRVRPEPAVEASSPARLPPYDGGP